MSDALSTSVEIAFSEGSISNRSELYTYSGSVVVVDVLAGAVKPPPEGVLDDEPAAAGEWIHRGHALLCE